MRKMSETEKAWLAGIIDGEGSICVEKSKNKRCSRGYSIRLEVSVRMSHKPTVSKIKELVGIGSFRKTQKGKNGNKPEWGWIITSIQAREFLESILEYLVTKKDNALNAIEFAKSMRYRPKGLTDEEFKKQLEHCKKSRALNDVRFD